MIENLQNMVFDLDEPLGDPAPLNAVSYNGDVLNKKDPLIENGISPEQCAQDIINGIMDNKKEIYSGGKGSWIIHLKRFFPEIFFKIMRKQQPS